MAGGCAWSRRIAARARTLRGLVRDTQRALQDVADILSVDPEICSIVSEIGNTAIRPTALVVLGSSAKAKVRLLHALIGRQLLPEDLPRGCRWVHLSLGNSEFELVEELQCNKRPWDILPVEDLLRREAADLTTIVEVEINNPFLKDGLRIIIPPDIATAPGASNHLQLKSMHTELYTKRSSILRSFNPVYFYSLDRLGKNIFSDNICGNMAGSRSDEDFWSTFNLYDMSKSVNVEVGGRECDKDRVSWTEGRGQPAVFNAENCLDLHQVKEINPHAQFLFILLSDAEELETGSTSRVEPEATEVSDEQTAFMNELVDQWELMSELQPVLVVKSERRADSLHERARGPVGVDE
ncbi:Dual serine/threonine and tyrosine protein kinase [Operophtera brumata]|uniref:Dual serine/threonine and tyrosine protein kinase n=1 Tax=Operophtera brumata TaxID=104452 RepID=A0A0L7LK33_OPEBR|nr:Dual serine/threonine and tyrosine protein kinase [Operophtera brumata]